MPNFDKVVVFNATDSKAQKMPRNKSIEAEDFFSGPGLQIKSFDDAKLTDPSGEHTLQRVTSYKTLDNKEVSEEEKEIPVLSVQTSSPRPLSKTDATSKLPDVIDEDEAELAR
jgi:hypothetical protein